MIMSLERPPSSEKGNWLDYVDEMAKHVDAHEPEELQQQLLEPHPVLPGEREAYLWLQDTVGEDIDVTLDDSGFHVIPRTLGKV